MKSYDAEAIAAIDRQIDEFEELLKELISSLYRLGFAEALLASIKPAPRDSEERRRPPALLGGLPRRSEKEQQIYEKEQQRRKNIKDRCHAVVCRQGVLERKYDTIYGETEYVLRKYFPSEDDLKKLRDNVVSNLRTQEKEIDQQFRRNPSATFGLYPHPPPIECKHYIQASKQCIFILRSCRHKIEKFGAQQGTFVQGDLIVGDKHENSIGDISNSTVSGVALGDNISIISNLNTSNQTGLAQALQTLTDAVLASQGLSDNDKKEHVEMVDDISKEAAKPNPNKRKLKSLADGLLAALKAVPDVAQAVTAVIPMLDQLHH